MKVNGLFVPVAATALLLGLSSVGKAQNINFTYTSVITAVDATNGTTIFPSPTTGNLLPTGGTGNGVFTVAPGFDNTTNNTIGGLATLRLGTFTPVFPTNGGTNNFAYTLSEDIAVNFTNAVTTFSFSGITFSGQFDNNSDAVFFGGIPTATQTSTNNGFVATLVLDGRTNPGTPLANQTAGTISGTLTVVAVPEPGTVAMLVGMGVSGSAFVLRRRRAIK